ncbi:MAG: M3 family oligoendopeptidase [Deltaproteobacteria bacterium]|nr:M3 family oligoendopeptidase [Deltaproteobacteria bacterium]
MTPNTKTKPAYQRKYLSPEFNAEDAAQVRREFEELARSDSRDRAELERWILHWEELSSAVNDAYARANVAVTVDTTDKTAEARFMKFVDEILPVVETEGFKLSRKLLAHPRCGELPLFYANFLRALRADVELYREENVPLKTEERKLVNEYEKITGSMTAVFRGQEMTLQQVARFLEDPERATRKEAFDARAVAKRKHAAALDDLYARMVRLRDRIARNAGFKNFRDYQFKAWHRFDYTPDDCFSFHSAIEKCAVPAAKNLHDERRAKLGVQTLKPWDMHVDPYAKDAVRPFEKVERLVEGCRSVFHKVDVELGGYFDEMVDGRLLDLESRKGKAPGGYCTQFSEQRVPFIFMNAAGTRRDVDTLLHEGGHSFHYFLSREIPLPSYHHTALEFAEVASMAMELLSRPHLGEFYGGVELDLVRNDQLRKILEFFPFMAMIDAFQHWVYTNVGAGAAEWRAKWAELERRFQPDIDWAGVEDLRDLGWQYPHVFSVPFYYVEYGIAQLGALSVWTQSLADYGAAVARYKAGLKLGAVKTLPELFTAVGARFGMDEAVLAPLVAAVQAEIRS